MKNQKWQNFLGALIVVFVFSEIFAIFFSRSYARNGNAAIKEFLLFLGLFVVVILFALIARWEISDKRDGIFLKLLGKKTKPKSFVIRTSFHLLPLYFTLLLVKMPLGMEYKGILFVLSLFSYALVELNMLYSKVIRHASRLNGKGKWGIILFMLIILLGIPLVTLYFTYSLIKFYMNRFPN